MVIFNKKAKSITGLENAMLQLFISFLTVAVFVSLKQGLIFEVAAGDWLPILVLGLINTGIGCYFYFSSIGGLPVQILGASLILGGAIFGEFAKKDR